jgi:hypothetical protein
MIEGASLLGLTHNRDIQYRKNSKYKVRAILNIVVSCKNQQWEILGRVIAQATIYIYIYIYCAGAQPCEPVPGVITGPPCSWGI